MCVGCVQCVDADMVKFVECVCILGTVYMWHVCVWTECVGVFCGVRGCECGCILTKGPHSVESQRQGV